MSFTAKYKTRCEDCPEPILAGQKATGEAGEYRHKDCATAVPPAPREDVVCNDCFIIKPCPCEVYA